MKSSLFFLTALFAPAACSSSSNQLLAEFQGKPDASGAIQQLTHMMAASQQKLGLAERLHGKVVKKTRKEADAFLQEEAGVYGGILSEYSTTVLDAEAELQRAVSEAKAGLKAAASAPQDPHDWKDPLLMEKTKLNAVVAAADRTVKKTEHQRKGAVREAKERSEESIDTEGEKLGMKLGDMTPVANKAKESLETRADKATTATAPVKASTASAPNKANLASLEDGISKAVLKERNAATAAETKLNGFLSKTDEDIAAKRAKIEQNLDAAQTATIAKVLGTPKVAKAAPAKKAKVVPAGKPAKAGAKDVALLKQDPCAGCDTGLAQAYQSCAMKHGNPCAETNAAGIVGSGPGQKKDISCCMKKEKHDRCLQCSSMDCAHNTCNVNKKYYSTYTIAEKFDDKKAMKKAGWGK